MKFDTTNFTAAEVTRVTGVGYQTLNYWAKIGLVKPTIRDAKGSGSRRLYNFQDLVAIRVALKLREAGVFGKALLPVLEVLRKAGFNSPAEVAIRVAPNGDVLVKPKLGETISARKKPGQLLFDFSCDCREVLNELTQLLSQEPGTSAVRTRVAQKKKVA